MMDQALLESAVMEVLTQEIVQRVWDKLLALQKNALVVCTGSKLAFLTWVVSLQQLEEAGFHFDLFLSENAQKLLDLSTLQRGVTFGKVWTAQDALAPEEIAAKYPTILVPALTINTASKIASCVTDTPASRMILNSMMRGKNVVVAVNGCCPDNPERASKGYQMTEPLRAQLRYHIERMRDFGATLATAETLASRTIKAIGSLPKADAAKSVGSYSVRGHKIISRQDVGAIPPGSTLYIPRGSQVTQLAAETARNNHITLIESNEV